MVATTIYQTVLGRDGLTVRPLQAADAAEQGLRPIARQGDLLRKAAPAVFPTFLHWRSVQAG
ncbi:MAG: hypothetical protein EOP02_08810 [Proteobacteria bacterium]|nr:MAG: hypothetical protein EOP02_08810 [Pseudomonadota bacterium]